MKILAIPEQLEVNLGSYGPACEGFIDLVKSFFFKKKDAQKEKVGRIKSARFQNASIVEKELEKDLSSTYDNPEWVKKNLEGNSGITKIPALAYAIVDGKNITNPQELIKIAQGMANIVKEVARVEKPFIDLRRRLIEQIKNEKDAAKVDQVWLQHAKELSVSAADRWMKKKQVIPAFGFDTKGKSWPVDLSNQRRAYFSVYVSQKNEGDGTFEIPTVQNAKHFAAAIRALIDICMEMDAIHQNNYVPYWDCLAAEYDDLKYGDEIFDYLCSNQSDHDLADLASGVDWILGHIACGLYIAMFDKYDKPAN